MGFKKKKKGEQIKKKPRRRVMLIGIGKYKNEKYERLMCHKSIFARMSRKRLLQTLIPKHPQKSSKLEITNPFSFLGSFLLLVFTAILKHWEINTDELENI